MHVMITRKGLFESSVIVGTVLLNMYMKCGVLAETLKTITNMLFKTNGRICFH